MYMRQYVQDGDYSKGNETAKILNRHNLHGENIIIGVGDTGIDVKHTLFYDKDHPVAYREERLDPDHRKIALYIPYADSVESSTAGHGTHVCGTIAGNSNRLSEYNVTIEGGG